jgi:hypothetical protein
MFVRFLGAPSQSLSESCVSIFPWKTSSKKRTQSEMLP